MISLAELPHFEDRTGLLWDLSDFFRDVVPEVSIRRTWLDSLSPSQKNETSRHFLANSSRSYSDFYVAEVHAKFRCGIDIELLDSSESNWSLDSKLFEMAMLAPGELDLIKASWSGSLECLPTVIWSSKEALAKALGDAQNYSPSQLLSPITWEVKKVTNWVARHLEIITEENRRLILWVVAEKALKA